MGQRTGEWGNAYIRAPGIRIRVLRLTVYFSRRSLTKKRAFPRLLCTARVILSLPFRARTCPDSRQAWRLAAYAWHESRRRKLNVKIPSRGDIIMWEGWTSRGEITRREYRRGFVCRCFKFLFFKTILLILIAYVSGSINLFLSLALYILYRIFL